MCYFGNENRSGTSLKFLSYPFCPQQSKTTNVSWSAPANGKTDVVARVKYAFNEIKTGDYSLSELLLQSPLMQV